jgi:hypothetical protein
MKKERKKERKRERVIIIYVLSLSIIAAAIIQRELERERSQKISEIVETEKRYVNDIDQIWQQLAFPLYQRPEIIDTATIYSIFSNWNDLLALGRDLLRGTTISFLSFFSFCSH